MVTLRRGGRKRDGTGADPVRSVNLPQSVSDDLEERIRDEEGGDLTVSYVLTILGEGYADYAVDVLDLDSPPNDPCDPSKSLSVRVSDELVGRIRQRAEAESLTVARVLSLLGRGYATGQLNLPRIEIVYPS